MIKTYNELLNTGYQSKILAHTSINNKQETLIDHSKKTLEYCDFLVDKLCLKENFTKILSQLVSDKQISVFLELIRAIIYYHDLGKINPVFQKEKMNNDIGIDTGILNSKHSFYGKILFDNLFYDDFDDKVNEATEQRLFFLLSQTIDRHHSPLKDIDFLAKNMCGDSVEQEICHDLDNVANKIFINWKKFYLLKDLYNFYSFKDENAYDVRKLFNSAEQQEALFYLYKMVYSLLIMSDYYATLDFMQNMVYFDKISVLTPELVNKCEKNFYEFKFNKKLNDKTYCEKLLNSDISDIDDLNDLRTRMLLESDNKLEESLIKQPEQRVFYLNIPTGGGKTNVSLKLTLTLLKSKKNIKRIFYVFPFINLIEQNHSVIKETFGLTEELSSVYSISTWNIEAEDKEEQLKYALDNEFLNHPFVVISNVNFFNTFVKSGKASNYRLINLANSIVIIDEIQSLNDKAWTLFNDLIEFGSKYLNIHFIIMSATLPKLDALSDVNRSSVALNLIDNPDGYFNHPKFKNRVLIDYRDNVNDLEQLLDVLKDELHDDMNKILLVVNTIKNSLELFKKIRNNKEIQSLKSFHAYLLNSTVLPHRRREIIQKMKEDKSKIILISTQSVEAGMDIDCDFGIRDFSIFDSIEQIAGRINRNFKNQKNPAKLIITNLKEDSKKIADFIYSDSYRWQTVQMNFASSESVKHFLIERNFDDYYTKVLENIKNRDSSPIHQSSYNTVKKGIRSLDFEELNKTDVIKQDSISIIINSEVPKEEFSCAELDFIKNEGITYEGEISGKSIWLKYNEFIKNFQRGHVDRKIKTKIWSSILSKFTINVRNYHIMGNQKLSDIIDLDKGIPLLRKEYYSNEEGIDLKLLKSNSFEILSH